MALLLCWEALRLCIGGLTFKFDKNSTNLLCFKFQFGAWNFVWGTKPTRAPPWRRDWAHIFFNSAVKASCHCFFEAMLTISFIVWKACFAMFIGNIVQISLAIFIFSVLKPCVHVCQLEIDRHGFFEADTDTSAIHGRVVTVELRVAKASASKKGVYSYTTPAQHLVHNTVW